MSDDLDPLLRAAIADTADTVEPAARLVRIRQETRRRTRRRRTWFAAGAAGLAVASVATIALATGTTPPPRAADPAATPAPSEDATAVAETSYDVFYVGPGPDGPDAPAASLYRVSVRSAGPLEALMHPPSDPDYRTLWPAGSLVDYDVAATEITVVLASDAVGPANDETARQQLAYTLQAAEQSDLPLALTYEFIDRGVAPITRAPELDVLSHMSIDSPAEGTVVDREDGSFTAAGRGNSFEASGACFLRGGEGAAGPGGAEHGPYLAQMSGWMEPRLFPWEVTVDVSDVEPGTYTFECRTDDPTGGAEGRGTDSDTRTVIVE